MRDEKVVRALHEPIALPAGFGLRQSSGAFRSGLGTQKRQRTAAVQDALASDKPGPRRGECIYPKVCPFRANFPTASLSLSPRGTSGERAGVAQKNAAPLSARADDAATAGRRPGLSTLAWMGGCFFGCGSAALKHRAPPTNSSFEITGLRPLLEKGLVGGIGV